MPKKIAALLFVCVCFLPLQASGGDDIAKLGKKRVDAAEKAYKVWIDVEWQTQLAGPQVYHLSVRWLHAELDVATKKEERITGYAAHLQRMKKDWRKIWSDLGKSRQIQQMLAIIDAAQIEAEYWLAKERARK